MRLVLALSWDRYSRVVGGLVLVAIVSYFYPVEAERTPLHLAGKVQSKGKGLVVHGWYSHHAHIIGFKRYLRGALPSVTKCFCRDTSAIMTSASRQLVDRPIFLSFYRKRQKDVGQIIAQPTATIQ